MRTSAEVTGGTSSTKWRANARAKSSICAIPTDRANANTVFFCESVGSTWAWSPTRCAAVKSPVSAVETLRSRTT